MAEKREREDDAEEIAQSESFKKTKSYTKN
jgi:hypothetical protein